MTSPGPALPPWIGPLALGAPLAVLVAATHIDPHQGWPVAWGAYMAAFLAWGALAVAWRSGRWRLSLGAILGAALLFRAGLCLSEPLFSDDIWRYIWDGRVQLAGVNPYAFPPADPALALLRDADWPRINHPEVPTIYPPAAQLVFLACAILGGGLLPLRLAMIAAELVALAALWRLAEPLDRRLIPSERDRDRAWLALLVLWNPLMIIEFSGSGHLDALAIAPMMAALALVAPARREPEAERAPLHPAPWLMAGICVGLSAAAKLLGLLLLPLLLAWAWWPRRWPERDGRPPGGLARCAALVLGAGIALAATAAPYQSALVFDQPGSFGKGLSTYVRKWRANDGLFGLMAEAERQILSHAPMSDQGPDRPHWRFDALTRPFEALGVTQTHEGRIVASTTFTRAEIELSLVKALVAASLALLLIFCLHQRHEPAAAALILLAALLLLSPTVHPWYVTWIVPLAALYRARSLLLWSGLVTLAYASAFLLATTGVWSEPVWIRVAEYTPVFFVLALEAGRRLSGEDPSRASSP